MEEKPSRKPSTFPSLISFTHDERSALARSSVSFVAFGLFVPIQFRWHFAARRACSSFPSSTGTQHSPFSTFFRFLTIFAFCHPKKPNTGGSSAIWMRRLAVVSILLCSLQLVQGIEGSDRKPTWIDYMADTGDGFGSTLTVIATMSQPTLNVSRATTESGELKREGELFETASGSHIIVGGDLTYPEPSAETWKRNFVLPFSFARSRVDCSANLSKAVSKNRPKMVDWLHSARLWTFLLDTVTKARGLPIEERAVKKRTAKLFVASRDVAVEGPKLWAVMGNHDSLDNGATFRRGICYRSHLHEKSTIALPQHHTFFNFSVKEWLFLGVDDQHTAGHDRDISISQFEYLDDAFREHREVHGNSTALIIILHQPFWLDFPTYPGPILREFLRRTYRYTRAIIAGDLHYYAHWAPEAGATGPHLIVSGGGGAFLHSTLHVNDSVSVDLGVGSQKFVTTPDGLFPSRGEMGVVLRDRLLREILVTLWFGALIALLSRLAFMESQIHATNDKDGQSAKKKGSKDGHVILFPRVTIVGFLAALISMRVALETYDFPWALHFVFYMVVILGLLFILKSLRQWKYADIIVFGLSSCIIGYYFWDLGRFDYVLPHVVGVIALYMIVVDAILVKANDIAESLQEQGDLHLQDHIVIASMIAFSIAAVSLRFFEVIAIPWASIVFCIVVFVFQVLVIAKGYISPSNVFYFFPALTVALVYWYLKMAAAGNLPERIQITETFQIQFSETFVVTVLCFSLVEYLVLFYVIWRHGWGSFNTKLTSITPLWFKWTLRSGCWTAWVLLGACFLWQIIVSGYLIASHFSPAGADMFSYFAIAGYKNFLRFRITPGGAFTLYPIGIMEPLSSGWICRSGTALGTFFATLSDASLFSTNTLLIEHPFQI